VANERRFKQDVLRASRSQAPRCPSIAQEGQTQWDVSQASIRVISHLRPQGLQAPLYQSGCGDDRAIQLLGNVFETPALDVAESHGFSLHFGKRLDGLGQPPPCAEELSVPVSGYRFHSQANNVRPWGDDHPLASAELREAPSQRRVLRARPGGSSRHPPTMPAPIAGSTENSKQGLTPSTKRPFDAKRHERNEAMKEHDHRALREAIVAVVRQTPLKVLLCPEDMTQMAVGKEMFLEKLPADVRPRVVWRENFWLTDEALSTYVRSAGLFGSEMHSPIMALGNGIPAIVCRFEEQTSKGIMWRDIGLGDWLFDLDRNEEHAGIVAAVLALVRDPAAAKAKVAQARTFVERRQRETMAVVKHYGFT